MKGFYLLLAIFYFFLSCHEEDKNIRDSRLSLKPVFKGYYSEPDSINVLCNIYVYYLVDIKLVNNSNSPVKFLATTCTTAKNIVVDKKEIDIWENACSGNSIRTFSLEPNQEFILPVIFRSKLSISNPIKIGFILLSPRDVDVDEFYPQLDNCAKNLEHILWSEPIILKISHETRYEIR